MPDKYIQLQADGTKLEVEGDDSSAGVGDAGKIVALDANGLINANMMPVGIGAEIENMVTTDNLAVGDWVNIYDNASVRTARLADASTGSVKKCHGFVLAVTTQPAAADVYIKGTNTGVAAVAAASVGEPAFLDTTPGAESLTAPTAAGDFVQNLGVYVSTTAVRFDYDEGVIRA